MGDSVIVHDWDWWAYRFRVVHREGIPGIEVCGGQIEEVTGIRCTLACFPIRFVTGEASIVRLVAMVEE